MHSNQESKRPLNSPPQTVKPSKISRSQEEEEQTERDQVIMSPNPRIQRYLVAFEYVGTRFFGSQKQPNFRTVTGTLEEAFHKFVGQPVSVVCSSRTDTGVHALCNVCHVDVERISKRKPGDVLTPHEPGVVRRAVNHFLQKDGDIMVTDVRCVPGDFHSRLKALERTYFYRLFSGPETLSTFEKERAWHIPEELNIAEMKKACSILTGHHDFSSFRASGCQVRLLVGLLKAVGTGEVPTSKVEEILNAKSVTAASPMAPACGLYLGNVKYDLPDDLEQ